MSFSLTRWCVKDDRLYLQVMGIRNVTHRSDHFINRSRCVHANVTSKFWSDISYRPYLIRIIEILLYCKELNWKWFQKFISKLGMSFGVNLKYLLVWTFVFVLLSKWWTDKNAHSLSGKFCLVVRRHNLNFRSLFDVLVHYFAKSSKCSIVMLCPRAPTHWLHSTSGYAGGYS